MVSSVHTIKDLELGPAGPQWSLVGRQHGWNSVFPKFTLAVKRRMDLLGGELGKYQDSREQLGVDWGERGPGVEIQGEVGVVLGAGWAGLLGEGSCP